MKCGEEFTCSPKITVGLRGADDPLLGQEFCGCEILELLGHGSLASVYKAEYLARPGTTVALKVFPPFVGRRFPQFVARYLAQSRRIADLNHPNIVPILQVGEERGFCFCAMKYVRGRSLEEYLNERRRMAAEDVVRAARAMSFGLQEAGNLGVLHRNIKPGNVFIGTDGIVSLADFALGPGSSAELKGSSLGTVVMNPHYLSPEQVRGDSIDGRSDIYSLGALLYRMVTGTVPFREENTLASVLKRLTVPADPPKRREESVPDELNDIIAKMMATEPGDRYACWKELLSALDAAFADSISEIPTEISADTNTAHTPTPADQKEDGTDTERVEMAVRRILEGLPSRAPGAGRDDLPEEPLAGDDRPQTAVTVPDSYDDGPDAPELGEDEEFVRELTGQLEALRDAHFPDLKCNTRDAQGHASRTPSVVHSEDDLPPPPPLESPLLPASDPDGFDALPRQQTTLGKLFLDDQSKSPAAAQNVPTPFAPGAVNSPASNSNSTPQEQTRPAPLTYVRVPHTVSRQTPGNRAVTPGGRRPKSRHEFRRNAQEKRTAIMIGAAVTTLLFAVGMLALWLAAGIHAGNKAEVPATVGKPAQHARQQSVGKAREAYEQFLAEIRRSPNDVQGLRRAADRLAEEHPDSAYTREARRIVEKQAERQADMENARKELKRRSAELQGAHRWGEAIAAAEQFARSNADLGGDAWVVGEVQSLEAAAASDFNDLCTRADSAEILGRSEEAKEIYRSIFVSFGIQKYVDQAKEKYVALVSSAPTPGNSEETKQDGADSKTGDAAQPDKAETAPLSPDFDLLDAMVRQWRFREALDRCNEYLGDPAYGEAPKLRTRKEVLSILPGLKNSLVDRINKNGKRVDAGALFGPTVTGTVFRASDRNLVVQNGVKVAPYSWDRIPASGVWKLVEEFIPADETPLRLAGVLLIGELGQPELVEPEVQRLAAAGVDVHLCRQLAESRK